MVALLALSLLPALWSPIAHEELASRQTGYAAWLLDQAPGSASPAISHAIEEALQADPASVEAFIDAFVTILETREGADAAEAFFAVPETAGMSLRAFLRARYLHFADSSLLAGLRLVSTLPASAKVLERIPDFWIATSRVLTAGARHLDPSVWKATPLVVVPIEMLSSARPQAP